MAEPSWPTASGSSRERICAATSSSISISRTAAAALPVIGRLATSASGIGFLLAVRFPQQVAHHQGGAVRVLLHEIADQRCPFGISLGGGNHIERDRQVRVGNGRTLSSEEHTSELQSLMRDSYAAL